MYGDGFDAGGLASSSSGAESTPEKAAASVATTGTTNASGQTVLGGEFKMKKWFDGKQLELLDTINRKGYAVSVLKIGLAKPDEKLAKNSKNQVPDAVAQTFRVKGIDTFGTFASVQHMSNIREVASIGHITALVEAGLPKAYPVRVP